MSIKNLFFLSLSILFGAAVFASAGFLIIKFGALGIAATTGGALGGIFYSLERSHEPR